MAEYSLPGPGTAMVLVIAVSIYTAGFAPVSNVWRLVFVLFALLAIFGTVYIELLHTTESYRDRVAALLLGSTPDDSELVERQVNGDIELLSLNRVISSLTSATRLVFAGAAGAVGYQVVTADAPILNELALFFILVGMVAVIEYPLRMLESLAEESPIAVELDASELENSNDE